MKKNLSILSALMVLLCGLMFTGCQHSIIADEATWYSTETELYGVDTTIWFYYSTEQLKTSKGTFEPGLTVVVIPEIPGVATYAVKNFAKTDSEVEVEDEDDTETTGSVKIKPNGTIMDALYVKYSKDFKKSATTTLPICFTNKSYVAVDKISELSSEFTGKGWKSIIKAVVNKALD